MINYEYIESELKAVSIRQPWAWLIVNGHKPYENREWKQSNPGRKFRGPVLIHAGKGLKDDEYFEALYIAKNLGINLPAKHELERGGIVGVAEFVQWHDNPPNVTFAFTSGFEIRNARPLPYRACRGLLGFFNPPVDWSAPVIVPEIRCGCGWQGLKDDRVEKPIGLGSSVHACPACGNQTVYLLAVSKGMGKEDA